MRALIDIDEQEIRELDRLARMEGRSRASLIRQAVSDFLKRRTVDADAEAFGLWGDRNTDGLAYQEKVRSEW